MHCITSLTFRRRLPHLLIAAWAAWAPASQATDFSVSPIRAELRPAAASETFTVTNHSTSRLRVSIRLVSWAQDEKGEDVHAESAELVYFPRQMDLDAGGKKVVRIGLRTQPGAVERAYRLYIEELGDPLNIGASTAVNFNFRFGVPVFVPPPNPVTAFEMQPPRVERGRLVVPARNEGTQHVRLDRVTVSEPGGAFTQQVPGGYFLAKSARNLTVDLPPDVCRRVKTLTVVAEGQGVRAERQLDVDPGRCS